MTSQAHPHDLQKPPPPPPPPIVKQLNIVDPVVDADGNLEEPEPLPEVPVRDDTFDYVLTAHPPLVAPWIVS